MRINKKVYPQLDKVVENMDGEKPIYVSYPFYMGAMDNWKIFTTPHTANELFNNDYANEIRGTPFIFLFNNKKLPGCIVYGSWGEAFTVIQRDDIIAQSELVGGNFTFNVKKGRIPEGVDATLFWNITKAIMLFAKYAPIKYKNLPKNGKLKEFNCKYKSDFDFEIGMYTETWYTECRQSHPFAVRGHWRWQPHGKGRKERRLQWIDLYMKPGFTTGPHKTK